MSFTANLNAASTTPPGNTELTVPMTIFDSLGTQHTLQVNFTKTATAGSWNYSVSIPASDLSSGTGSLVTGSVTFNPNGTLATPTVPVSIPISNFKDGASNQTVTWALYDNSSPANGKITQFAQGSQYDNSTQDGVGAGNVTKVAMGPGGQVIASFSNGQTRAVSQVALAKFVNTDSLIGVGNNNFSASTLSSLPSIGTAGSKGIGQVISNALEGSNVDVATQFTNLITYQRGYQASSKVITTADQMLDEIMQVIR
jgi:flagellar hook protein FlgE